MESERKVLTESFRRKISDAEKQMKSNLEWMARLQRQPLIDRGDFGVDENRLKKPRNHQGSFVMERNREF